MVVLYDKIVYIEKVEREFIYTEPFLRCWKAIGLGDDEQHELEDILLENPRKGVVIEGLAGIRKLRIRLEGRGQSGVQPGGNGEKLRRCRFLQWNKERS